MEKIGIKMTNDSFTHQDFFARKTQEKLSQQGKFPDERNVFIKGRYILN